MINSELTDDQRKAFDKFSKLKVGALFMKMGTGKTRVAFMLKGGTTSGSFQKSIPRLLRR
jgi:hypothetical protein